MGRSNRGNEMRILRRGTKSPDVRRVQQALNMCMLPPNNRFTSPAMKRLVEDGDFGMRTEAMVREFQRLNQVSVDGVVGPITSYLLFPYISFKSQLAGRGLVRGRFAGAGDFPSVMPGKLQPPNFTALRSQLSRLSPSVPVSGGSKAKEVAPGAGGEDEERQGLTFEVSAGPGFKHEFQPWFVLKPGDDPEGGKTLATLTVEATVLRFKGLEFGGELEFSRQLGASGGSSWEWEGALTGKYTNLKIEGGPVSLGISPIVELKVKQGLLFGAAAGGEVEAAVELRKDLLELTVGGKIAGEWDPHEGNVEVGGEITAGLKLKWDLVRTVKKK